MATEHQQTATCLPIVFITARAKMKLDLYVEKVPVEVSGLGSVEVLPDGSFLISDIFLFQQECTDNEWYTKLSSKSIGKIDLPHNSGAGKRRHDSVGVSLRHLHMKIPQPRTNKS